MTKNEIMKKFPWSFKYGVYGHSCECMSCAYFETCEKMLPGFTRPKKCAGPFYKDK